MKRRSALLGFLAATATAASALLAPATATAAPIIDTSKKTFVEVTSQEIRDLIGAGDCTIVNRIPVKNWYVITDVVSPDCSDGSRTVFSVYRVKKGKATSVGGSRPMFFDDNCTVGVERVPYRVMRAVWDQYAGGYGFTCGALTRTSPKSKTQKAIGKVAAKGYDARCVEVLQSAANPSWAVISYSSDWARQHQTKCQSVDIPYRQIVKRTGKKWKLLDARLFAGIATDDEIARVIVDAGVPTLPAADIYAYNTGGWTPPWWQTS